MYRALEGFPPPNKSAAGITPFSLLYSLVLEAPAAAVPDHDEPQVHISRSRSLVWFQAIRGEDVDTIGVGIKLVEAPQPSQTQFEAILAVAGAA